MCNPYAFVSNYFLKSVWHVSTKLSRIHKESSHDNAIVLHQSTKKQQSRSIDCIIDWVTLCSLYLRNRDDGLPRWRLHTIRLASVSGSFASYKIKNRGFEYHVLNITSYAWQKNTKFHMFICFSLIKVGAINANLVQCFKQ